MEQGSDSETWPVTEHTRRFSRNERTASAKPSVSASGWRNRWNAIRLRRPPAYPRKFFELLEQVLVGRGFLHGMAFQSES